MNTHAEYHAANPLPNLHIPTERRKQIILNPVEPVKAVLSDKPKRAQAADKPKRLRKGKVTGTMQEYLDKRERTRDQIRASIQDALKGSPPLSISTIGDMLDLHRCRVLPHLKALEEAGIVKHRGAQNKTRWYLVNSKEREP